MLTGITSISLNGHVWLALWGASMGSWFLLWFWLRRFNVAKHEREEVGVPGMALALFAGPIYVAAAIAALLRRPLAYAVTAKGKLKTTESISTFRLHLMWAAAGGALLAASFIGHHDFTALRVWSCLTIFTGIAPPVIAALTAMRNRFGRKAAPELLPVAPMHVPEQRQFAYTGYATEQPLMPPQNPIPAQARPYEGWPPAEPTMRFAAPIGDGS
jgi:hypothetical protein